MQDFPVRTPKQLSVLLAGFRKTSGLTQAEVARRLGVSQQTFSALERNADRATAGRLLKLLQVLGVEMVLRQPSGTSTEQTVAQKPAW
jgi:HTH-type transcriptional regulator / antitoxin HipB